MLIRIMQSVTVFVALYLVRLLCSWIHRFLSDDGVHYDFADDTFVSRLLLIISVLAMCELVLRVPSLVIFGKMCGGQSQIPWPLEHLVWSSRHVCLFYPDCVSPLVGSTFLGGFWEISHVHCIYSPSFVGLEPLCWYRLTISFDADYGLCLNSLQRKFRLIGLQTLCWYHGFCIHFFRSLVLASHLSPACWQFLFENWVWIHLSLLGPALSSVAGRIVWTTVSTVLVATLVSGYCFGMAPLVYDEECISSLRWNCSLSILIVGSLCTFSISSSLVQMGWFAGLCTHFVTPFFLSPRSLPVCCHLYFSFWVWMRSCQMIFTCLSAPGNGRSLFGISCWSVSGCTSNGWRILIWLALFASCWVWSRGDQRFALFSSFPGSYRTILRSLVSCWNERWISCVLQPTGLCVTRVFDLVQPQSPIVFPLVYDDAFLWHGLPETFSLPMLFCLWICVLGRLHHLSVQPVWIDILMSDVSSWSLSLVSLSVLRQVIFSQHLFSYLSCAVSFLCPVMVRGCKVRTLQPMASPLHHSTGWAYFPAFLIAMPRLNLSYFSVHNVLVCLWVSFASSLSSSFLCLVVMELTGSPVGIPLAPTPARACGRFAP